MNDAEVQLRASLERARTLGFLGPGAVEAHLDHAFGFADVAERTLCRHPSSYADLGSGGGIPGLALAFAWPSADGVLVEVGRRRADHLRREIAALGLTGRVTVVEERAELTAQRQEWRERFELVTARSFAPPPVTAEIAAGLVVPAGVLVVSEPPTPGDGRWPDAGLADLGFARATPVDARGAHYVVVEKRSAAPKDMPRGVGRPAKRPRW